MAFPETVRLVYFAHRANGKKRTLIRAIMNPPSFHLTTRSQGVVPPSLVEESPHLMLDRPGRLAPAWLEALISGELHDQEPNVFDVGCANATVRREAVTATGRSLSDSSNPPPIRHELLLKGHQSVPSEGPQSTPSEPTRRADGRECTEVYSCVCQNCRYHFTFYIDRNKGISCGQSPSDHSGDRKDDEKNPFHHLVYVTSDTKPPSSINTRYYPYSGHVDYICSAKGCSFRLVVEVSSPRLSQHFLAYLSDNDRISRRLALAIEREPERFTDAASITPNALLYLRVYLRDIVDGKKEFGLDGVEVERKIDQRNKKFYIQFGDGPDAAEFFSYLGFKEVVDHNSRIWKIPSPPVIRPTRPGSQLAFYQDVKSEVETIIGKDSQNMKPNAAISFITSGLGIGAYATSRKDYAQYRFAYYDLLGLLPDMHEAYFWYAFGCQRQTDPSNEIVYFRALQQLARGRNNEELEMQVQSFDSMLTDQPIVVGSSGNTRTGSGSAPGAASRAAEEDEIRLATELSLRELQSKEVAEVSAAAAASTASYYEQQQQPQQRQGISEDSAMKAYNYFGLQNDDRSDASVLEKFETLCESYPSQRSMYREKLLLLARYTDSKQLLNTALQTMDLDEALAYIGVQKDSEPEYIINVAQFISNYGEKDLSLIARALGVIGIAYSKEHPGDVSFSNAAAVMLAQNEGSEAGGTFPCGDSNSGATPYMQMMDIDGSSATDPELPVGLVNIRNTCYLNSILQYFFTVNPVRAIALDYERYGFELTPDNLQHRRIDPGSTHLEKGEAYAGQQFVHELASLFQELLTCQAPSCRPPQRLALAALKNAKQLELDGAKILARDQDQSSLAFDLGPPRPYSTPVSGRASPAPPLPTRHPPAAPLQLSPRPERPPTSAAAVPAAPAMLAETVAPTEMLLATKAAANPLDGDYTDTTSTRSSQTLVNQTEDSSLQTVGRVSPQLVAATGGAGATNTDEATSSSSAMGDLSERILTPKTDEQPPSYSEIDSSDTLLANTARDDVAMADAEDGTINILFDPPPVAEVSVEEKIGRALNDSSVTGTDQQDVEEVMGNIISHLRAAVKATGEDGETGAQEDPVTDTFFWTSVTYSRSNGAARYNRQVAPNRWVTAYPDEGGQVIGLLDALDNSFRREFISQGPSAGRYERFTSILKLPPILHVHIQRTTRDGGKNNAAIDIPSVLQLDRFMDSPLTEEQGLFARRRRAWNLQERLRTLRGPGGEYPDLDFPATAIGQAAAYTDLLMDDYLASGKKGKRQAHRDGEAEADGMDTDMDDGMPEKEEDASDGKSDSDYFVITDEVKQMLDANGIALATQDALDEALEAGVAHMIEQKTGGNEVNRRFAEEALRLTREDVAAVWRPRKKAKIAAAADGDGDDESPKVDEEPFEHVDVVTPAAVANRLRRTKIPAAAEAGNNAVASRDVLAEQYRSELQGLFSDLQAPACAYRLHAVICHAGQTGKSGHYWVWIYDFALAVWRRYNDSVVTEERDTAKVMRALSTQGEPYYLAYVRESDVERMVKTPTRTAAARDTSAVTVRETSASDVDENSNHGHDLDLDDGEVLVTTTLRPAPTRNLRPLQPQPPLPGPPPGPPPAGNTVAMGTASSAVNAATGGLASVQELDEGDGVEVEFVERADS